MDDKTALKQVFSAFATGVMVAATEFEGRKYALTISSFSSVSLDPALCSFCIGNGSRNLEPFKLAQNYSLSILSNEQKDVALEFAKIGDDKNWDLLNNDLIVKNSLAYLKCKPYDVFKAGDHHIFVGEIGDSFVDFKREGLIYYKSKFLV